MLRIFTSLLLLISWQALAIEQCDSRFPTPVNGLNSGTKLKGASDGQIYGTSNHGLGFKKDQRLELSGSFRCYDSGGSGSCSATGTVASDSDGFPKFQTQNGSKKIEVGEGRSRTLNTRDGDVFEEILVKKGGHLAFESGQTYRIDTLKLEDEEASVTLESGTYWVVNIELGKDARVYVEGNVVLHVQTMTIGEESQVNMDQGSTGKYLPQKLDIWNHSNELVLKKASRLAGYIYSADKIKLEEGAWVYGALTGKKEVVMEKSTRVYGDFSCSINPEPNTVRLIHPDTAISCVGAEVVVDVCSNSNCTAFDTSNTYSLALTATGSVTWQNLRTGDTGSTLQVQHNDRLRLWQSDAINNVDVTIGVSSHASQCLSGDGDSDCLITFTPSGLLLSTGQNYQTSCKTGDNLQVSVVETSTQDPQQCLPVTAGDEPVAFTFQYANPSSGLSVSEPLLIDGVSLNTGEALTRQMNFETDGIDQLPIQYDEAGKLTVRATMNRGQGSGQVTLSGEADLDWLPAGLHISAGDTLCTAGDENCSPLMKAGNSVDVNVTAHCWVANDDGNFGNNPRTRNFRHSGIDLEPELVAPSGGQNSADLPADASGNAVIGNDGSGTVARVLDEVGVFRFVPKNDIDYLGHQLAKSSASSANIGRVTPAYLGAETANTALGAYCNSFSYLGQPVPYTSMPVVTVTGYATDGSVTNNFDSAFWNLPNPMGSRAYGTQNASVSVQEPSGIAVTEADANDLDGSRRFSVNKNWISFARPTAPVAPLGTTASGSQTTLSLPAGAFTVSGDQLCLGQWGSCQSAAFTTQSGGASLGYVQGPQLRYGRAVLASAYGSENQVVRMPLTLEYYNGQQFATNLLDTGFYGDGRALNTGSPATSGRVTLTGSLSPLPVTSGQAYSLSGVFGSLSIAGAGAVTNPPLTLEYHLEHPFASQTGCTFPEAASMAPTWLQWYWDKDNPSVLHNPSAEVTLGRYRGHDKVIYRREVF